MEYIAAILVFFFIMITILVNVQYRRAKKKKQNQSQRTLYTLPNLGIQQHTPSFRDHMSILLQHLDQSLTSEYIDQVKERVVREHKISLNEWENRWFEWQRYLVLTSILKSVPMYSREVDTIWHEMLMFTREYKAFSDQFLGSFLHHTPNPDTTRPMNRRERAWFDLNYVILFRPTEYSSQTWGVFLENRPSSVLIRDLDSLTEEEFIQKHYNYTIAQRFPFVKSIILYIVQYLQSENRKNKELLANARGDLEQLKTEPRLQAANHDAYLNKVAELLFDSRLQMLKRFQETKIVNQNATSRVTTRYSSTRSLKKYTSTKSYSYTTRDRNDPSDFDCASDSSCSGSSCSSSSGGSCGGGT